jgi:uncharacterized SAM-binding protein YcdF (DUF218 family)
VRRRPLFRLALVALLAAMLALIAGIGVIDQYGMVDRAQAADVIIVLGSRVQPDGGPAPALARRAAHAAALYRQGLAPAVMCSGGVTAGTPLSEAASACGYAVALGVPPEATFLEEMATSTEENARYSAVEMRRHGWRTAILASDGFHLYRAVKLFEHAGVTVYPSPAQATAGPMAPVERWLRAAREVLALIWTQIRWGLEGFANRAWIVGETNGPEGEWTSASGLPWSA